MLVLSRKQKDKVVFPNLGITVEILKIAGNQIRLGIDAPPEVQVLRHEVAEKQGTRTEHPFNKLNESLRARLHLAASELNELYQQIETGNSDEVETNIFRIFRELQSMDDDVAGFTGQGTRILEGNAKRALLVDDNLNETRLLAGYLRCRKIEVATANDGAEAVSYLARRAKPDFMLLDMNMPRFDGRWTVDEIRRDPRNTDLTIFAVSGIDPREYGVEIGPRGINGWYRKPLDPEALVNEMIVKSKKLLAASPN